MDDFYYEDTSGKSVVIKLLVGLVIVACVVLLSIYLINRGKLNVKTIKLEVGSAIPTNVSSYVKGEIKDADEYTVKVNGYNLGDETTKTGEIEFTVTHIRETKKGTIKIVDTKAPKVEASDLTVGVGEKYSLDEFITSCEDYSKPCDVTSKNETDDEKSSTAGEYSISLTIADQAGNKVKKNVKLIVKEGYSREDDKKKDLEISKVDPTFDDFDKKNIFLSFTEAFNPTNFSAEGYEKLYEVMDSDLSAYLPERYAGSTVETADVIYLYNRYGYIVGFAIRANLASGSHVYLTN